MALTKKQLLSLIFVLALIAALPAVIFLTKKQQDIRPRALQGKANLLLNAANSSPKVGESFDVLVSMNLTDSNLKVSGADFILLYDKSKLSVTNVVPAVGSSPSSATPFTDAIQVSKDGNFDAVYNFLRVAEVSRVADSQLMGGTVQLAKVTFVPLAPGSANIKFPDSNENIEIVGIGINSPNDTTSPSATPTVTNSAAVVKLSFSPDPINLMSGQSGTVDLVADYAHTAGASLDNFSAEIIFPKDQIQMSAGQYADVTMSGYDKTIRVDGPTVANSTGKIIVKLGVNTAGTGPKPGRFTVARIPFTGTSAATGSQTVTASYISQ